MSHKKTASLKKEDIKAIVKGLFTDYLQEHNQRKTPERYAILEKIYDTIGHFTIDTLHSIMTEDFQVSRATVYNTLELLADCHLVIKHHFHSEYFEYEKAYNNLHHHLICTNCRKIKEYSDENIKKIIRAKPLGGFEVKNFSIYTYGICHKCAKQLKNNKLKKAQTEMAKKIEK